MSKLNSFQTAAKNAYAGGDFSYVESVEESVDVGDSLFTFLMRELSESEGCDSRETALQRLESAKRDIEDVIASIESL